MDFILSSIVIIMRDKKCAIIHKTKVAQDGFLLINSKTFSNNVFPLKFYKLQKKTARNCHRMVEYKIQISIMLSEWFRKLN